MLRYLQGALVSPLGELDRFCEQQAVGVGYQEGQTHQVATTLRGGSIRGLPVVIVGGSQAWVSGYHWPGQIENNERYWRRCGQFLLKL